MSKRNNRAGNAGKGRMPTPVSKKVMSRKRAAFYLEDASGQAPKGTKATVPDDHCRPSESKKKKGSAGRAKVSLLR